jgi:hypothetical protein
LLSNGCPAVSGDCSVDVGHRPCTLEAVGERSTNRIGPEPVRLPVGLAMSLVFDEHDVLANRRGQLSGWQRERLAHVVHVDVSIGVPTITQSSTPGMWHVRVGDARFDLDGGTVAGLDTNSVLRVYTAALGPGSPTLLSAEVIDLG